MTFQGKPIHPEKPIYILCGSYTGKKKDTYFPVKANEKNKYPHTKVFRGIITEIRFHQDEPGIAKYIRLWCSNMEWPEIRLYEREQYYWGTSVKDVKSKESNND